MTDKQRYEKYIKEHCTKCKNKDKEDCEIRILNRADEIITKCEYYEREN